MLKDIEKRFSEPNAPLQLLKDEVKRLLALKKLMIKAIVDSKWLGVHPENRYGDGVVPADVLGLISDIYSQGASKSALLEPTACEAPPSGHSRQIQFEAFNKGIIGGSGGQLPEFEDYLNGGNSRLRTHLHGGPLLAGGGSLG